MLQPLPQPVSVGLSVNLHKRSSMPIQTFRCQFCDTEYSTFAQAEKCEQELHGVDKETVFNWTDQRSSF